MVRKTTRTFLTKVHLLIAAFIFPAIAMFLVTGGLYTWGVTGEYVDSEHRVALSEPLSKDKDVLRTVAARELDRLGIAPPSGSPGIRSVADGYRLEWTGANRDVHLAPTDDAAVALLTVKDTTLHRRLVQLHKAKGATLFKIYATVLAAALFLLVVSGLILCLITPAFRVMTYWASAIGLAVFGAAVALS